MGASIQDGQRLKGGVSPTVIEPDQELLKMNIDRQGSGLVDHLATRCEFRAQDGSAASMPVSQVSLYCLERAWIGIEGQRRPNVLPIRAEVLQEFEAGRDPVLNAHGHLACEHRIT